MKIKLSIILDFKRVIIQQDTLWFFNDQLCRAMPLVFDQELHNQEVPCYRQIDIHLCILGYDNFINNDNFHLLHFAVHQTTDFIFAFNLFLYYQIRQKILRHPYYKSQRVQDATKVFNKKYAENNTFKCSNFSLFSSKVTFRRIKARN